jgi:hypothetical protein
VITTGGAPGEHLHMLIAPAAVITQIVEDRQGL